MARLLDALASATFEPHLRALDLSFVRLTSRSISKLLSPALERLDVAQTNISPQVIEDLAAVIPDVRG